MSDLPAELRRIALTPFEAALRDEFRDEVDDRYPSATQRCAVHGTFRVLADEVGMHSCPSCPEEPAIEEDERDDDS